jgi:tellurite resistance protein TerC
VLALVVGITLFVALVVLADLYGIHRAPERPSPGNEWRTAGLYAALAAAFAGFLWAAVDGGWLDLGLTAGGNPITGRHAASDFLGAFIWQTALDMDTVFVVAALFVQFKTPRHVQHRVLLWGVLLGLLVRGALTAGCGWALQSAWWVRYVGSGFLVLAALRMLVIRQENLDPEQNTVISILKRFAAFSQRAEGPALLTREGGRLAFTPLVMLVVLLETADAFMTLDSIPAGLAITRNPLMVFAGNAFALLCLRSLYVALEHAKNWLRHVKIGLACSLGYAAVVMSLREDLRPPVEQSVAVLLLSVAAGLIIGVGTRQPAVDVSALGPEADQLARATLRHARTVIATVVGATLLVVGLALTVLPGPGLPVIFVGLAILGNEFAWARQFMHKYRVKAEQAVEASASAARKRFRPWVLAPLMLGTIAGFVLVGWYFKFRPSGVLVGLIPALIGQAVWGYLAFFRARPPA